MNEGLIYKIIFAEGKIKYCIRLDRNVMINNVEYNIYIDKTKNRSKYKNAAMLFSVDREFETKLPLPICTRKKYNFTLIFKDNKNDNDKKDKIISIEETAIGEK